MTAMTYAAIKDRLLLIEENTKSSIRWLCQIIDEGEYPAGHDTAELLKQVATCLQYLEESRDHYEIEHRKREGRGLRLEELAYAVPKEEDE